MTPTWLKDNAFCVVDLETTSKYPDRARIVSIGIVPIDDGTPGLPWRQLVQPGCRIDPGATAVHGLDWAALKNAPFLASVWPAIAERCRGRIFVGYGFITFDRTVLKYEMARIGVDPQLILGAPVIDVLPLVRAHGGIERESGRHKLIEVARRWGISLDGAHTALGDARITWAVFMELIQRVPAFQNCALSALLHPSGGPNPDQLSLGPKPAPAPDAIAILFGGGRGSA